MGDICEIRVDEMRWELYVLIRDGLDEGLRREPEAMAGSIYISVDGQFRSKSYYSTSE